MSDKIDIEKLLAEGQSIMIEPIGTSMYPLFVDRHDKAIIVPAGNYYRKLRRGDVCVYRRNDNRLIIHRIWKVAPDGIYFVGDHQKEIEGPISSGRILGIMVSFIRLGKEYSVYNIGCKILSTIWLMLRPVRANIIRCGSTVKKILRGLKN